LRLPRLTKSEDDYYKQLDDDFGKKLKEMQKALFEYLKYFEIGTEAIVVVENGLPKVSCNSAKDDELTKRCIVGLGRLLSRLRGVVPTWHTQDTQGSDYAYGIATIEEPDRAITQLRNLARGHALSQGRNYITSQDLPIVIKVVLSTASIERVTIFDILISNKGRPTTTQITTSLNITPHTAHRTMVELNALGLVDMPSIGDKPNTEKQIIIKSEFGWFLSEEFTQLREAFVPEDNSDVQYKQETKQLEEKIPLSSQENNDSDSIVVKDNDGIMERKLEENLPLTNANLIPFNQQQLEEKSTLTTSNYDSGKHEEKITNITQKINNNNRQQIGIENIEVAKYNRAAKNTPAITASIFIIRFIVKPIKKPAIPPKPIVLTNGMVLLSMPLIFLFPPTFFGCCCSRFVVFIVYVFTTIITKVSFNSAPNIPAPRDIATSLVDFMYY
jgi:hypothetical protein